MKLKVSILHSACEMHAVSCLHGCFVDSSGTKCESDIYVSWTQFKFLLQCSGSGERERDSGTVRRAQGER